MRISDWSSDVCSSDLNLGNGFDGHDPGPAKTADQKIAGDGEEIGIGAINMVDAIQGREPGIGFLNQFVDILLRRMAREPGAHGSLVGNDMLGHPRGHAAPPLEIHALRSEEHTSELQSLMPHPYAV